MVRVGWIGLSRGRWIWEQGMAGDRLDGNRGRREEIEILLEAVRVKKIPGNPSGWQWGELPRIKIKLEPLPESKTDEAIIGSAQQIEHVSIASVISRRMCIGTGHASIRIRINGVARRLQPDFARIANEIEGRLREWHLGHTHISYLRCLIDSNRIPINLQIVDDANSSRSFGTLAGQVCNHGPFEPRRKAHLFHNAHPFPMRIEGFYIRWNYFDSRLIRFIHRSRGEVIGIATDDQSQWLLRVPFTEVELDPMQLGEPRERQLIETRDVFAVAP